MNTRHINSALSKMLIAASLTFATAGAALAERGPLSGGQIKDAIAGKKVFLRIPFGGEFPLKYSSNGILKGDGTGTGVARFFSPKDEGRWWVRDGKLCQKWEEWYEGRTFCFVISDYDGTGFTWLRDDGRKGKGRIE
ncbi:MAG: hypothetical protein AAGE61_17085 [Pseudomonadota bacterium]